MSESSVKIQAEFTGSSAAESHKNGMWFNNTQINSRHQTFCLCRIYWSSMWTWGKEQRGRLGSRLWAPAPPDMHNEVMCPTRDPQFAWSITSDIISHVMKALVPLPCFLFSHTPQTGFFSPPPPPPPTPNNKLSHPFFITQVFQRWSSLKVRGAFLWPEGHHRLNLLDLQWKPRWGWGGRRGGGGGGGTSQPPSACPWATHSDVIGPCEAAL